jgi:SAM-dependent methyltransferase
MPRWKTTRTEFYEAAVEMGFYGTEDSSLTGKKDNVRKFWEDIYIKLVCRPFVEKLLSSKNKLRVLDLGCGSGEGIELLTHIPPSHPKSSVGRDFVLNPGDIDEYIGIDLSPSMISQARKNYRKEKNYHFEYADLMEGLPSIVLRNEPYDLYFSSYGSLSHLPQENFENLFVQICKHAKNGSVFVFDIHAKFSPAWPKYWGERRNILPYTMAYLFSEDKRKAKKIEWFNLCFWTIEELKARLNSAAGKAKVKINITNILDRSVFVGRHIDTGMLSTKPMPIRYQVNQLLDRGYRGKVEHLTINIEHLEPYKDINSKVWDRLVDMSQKWNRIIYLLDALQHHDDIKVKNFIENTNIELMSDDLKLLTWLFRNSDRFPVVDFWASLISPQVAVILRNIEMSYQEGVGCGHAIVGTVEIIK